MPKLQQLNSFKESAKSILGNDFMKDRSNFQRDEAEEQVVRAKIKALSDRTGVDYSPLYQSIMLERQLTADHKRSFEFYKKFKFLKSEEESSKIKKLSEDGSEPFEYPPVNQTVRNLISNESMRVSIIGEESEPSQKYGR